MKDVKKQSENNGPFPLGTQVALRDAFPSPGGEDVLPVGAVGVISKWLREEMPPAYQVLMACGRELVVPPEGLVVLNQYQAGVVPPVSNNSFDYFRYVIYRCVVGSTAFGLAEAGSDRDIRGIFLPPAERHWSLQGVPEHIERQESEEFYWELEKFLRLGLKANPNVLECLYTPMVEWCTPLAEEMLAIRSAFLSKMVYQTYNGYVLSQYKKMEADRRNYDTVRWKHAMHLVRLLIEGTGILQTGEVYVDVGIHRGVLLSIRHGEMDWETVERERMKWHQLFETAYAETRLPSRPDVERVNGYLIRTRRFMVEGGCDL